MKVNPTFVQIEIRPFKLLGNNLSPIKLNKCRINILDNFLFNKYTVIRHKQINWTTNSWIHLSAKKPKPKLSCWGLKLS